MTFLDTHTHKFIINRKYWWQTHIHMQRCSLQKYATDNCTHAYKCIYYKIGLNTNDSCPHTQDL